MELKCTICGGPVDTGMSCTTQHLHGPHNHIQELESELARLKVENMNLRLTLSAAEARLPGPFSVVLNTAKKCSECDLSFTAFIDSERAYWRCLKGWMDQLINGKPGPDCPRGRTPSRLVTVWKAAERCIMFNENFCDQGCWFYAYDRIGHEGKFVCLYVVKNGQVQVSNRAKTLKHDGGNVFRCSTCLRDFPEREGA